MRQIKWHRMGYFNLIGLGKITTKMGLHKSYRSYVFNLPFMTVIHIKVR